MNRKGWGIASVVQLNGIVGVFTIFPKKDNFPYEIIAFSVVRPSMYLRVIYWSVRSDHVEISLLAKRLQSNETPSSNEK